MKKENEQTYNKSDHDKILWRKVNLGETLKDGGVGGGRCYFREDRQGRCPWEDIWVKYGFFKVRVTSPRREDGKRNTQKFPSSEVDPQFLQLISCLPGLSGFHKVPLISFLITCLIQLFLNQIIIPTPYVSGLPHALSWLFELKTQPTQHFPHKTTHLQKLGDQLHLEKSLTLYPRTQSRKACCFPTQAGKVN